MRIGQQRDAAPPPEDRGCPGASGVASLADAVGPRPSVPQGCLLETHVWHAKRMHMVDYWGYRVAERAVHHCNRAAFRFAAHSCALHDASYLQCLELAGAEKDVSQCLGLLASPCVREPRAVAAASLLRGQKSVTCAMYAHTSLQWPTMSASVGPITIIYRPRGCSAEAQQQVWLLVHPSSAAALGHALQVVSSAASGKLRIRHLQHEFNVCVWVRGCGCMWGCMGTHAFPQLASQEPMIPFCVSRCVGVQWKLGMASHLHKSGPSSLV